MLFRVIILRGCGAAVSLVFGGGCARNSPTGIFATASSGWYSGTALPPRAAAGTQPAGCGSAARPQRCRGGE